MMNGRPQRCLDEPEQCDFVSEVHLNEDDVRAVALSVRRDAECTPTRNSLGKLLLAAVGCAMRDYDERGFWYHFISMLGTAPGINPNRLRPLLQEALIRWNFLDAPRTGTHSTVTPILNQAGVTPRAMPAFASVLSDGKRRAGGWREFCDWPLPKFLNFLNNRPLGRALREFLSDEDGAGWRYTSAVAKTLGRLENGLLDEESIYGLRGYREGFWNDLREYLGGAVAPRTRMGRHSGAPAPRCAWRRRIFS